jgi:hypothetical protein
MPFICSNRGAVMGIYAFAIEPGAAFLENDSNLWTPADYAITYGVPETIRLFEEWLIEQVASQRECDRDAMARFAAQKDVAQRRAQIHLIKTRKTA